MFLYKNLFFFNIFYSFNPNHAYWNQRRLFCGNLRGMFYFYLIIERLSEDRANQYGFNEIDVKFILTLQSSFLSFPLSVGPVGASASVFF